MHYKTYCFAFQNRRFCTVKAAVLHRKTYAFATPNRNYRFSSELSLQNHCFYVGVRFSVRLPAAAQPLHLVVARYTFDKMPAQLPNNRTKSVKNAN